MRPASATPPPTGCCSVFSGAPASSLSSASSHRPVSPEVDDALPALSLPPRRQRDRLGGSRHDTRPGNALRAACWGSNARDCDRLRRLARPRVFAPSSLAALVFGIVAVRSGHWGSPLWVRLGIGAFAVSVGGAILAAVVLAATALATIGRHPEPT